MEEPLARQGYFICILAPSGLKKFQAQSPSRPVSSSQATIRIESNNSVPQSCGLKRNILAHGHNLMHLNREKCLVENTRHNSTSHRQRQLIFTGRWSWSTTEASTMAPKFHRLNIQDWIAHQQIIERCYEGGQQHMRKVLSIQFLQEGSRQNVIPRVWSLRQFFEPFESPKKPVLERDKIANIVLEGGNLLVLVPEPTPTSW